MVMVIVCIALASAAPALRDFWRGSRTRDEALQIMALTRWARSQSVAQARVHGLRFDPGAGTYRLETSDGLGTSPLLTEFGRTFVLPEDCRVEVTVTPGAEPNCIRFYPNGRSDGVRIRLSGPGTEEHEVAAPSPTEDFELRGDGEEAGMR